MKVLGLNLKRLNRSSYILTTLVSMFVFVAVGMIFSGIFNALLGPIDPSMPESPHPLGLLPFMTLWFVYFTLCSAKRFHDMDMSGLFSLAIFLPFVGFFAGILLLFVKGTEKPNRYGEPVVGFWIMGVSPKRRE